MKISITIEGVEVEGTILLRIPHDIVVEITRPYQGLRGKSHIPYFMTKEDFRGPFGDERAQTLLEDLYLCGRFLYSNLASLRNQWAELQKSLRTAPVGKISIYTHEDFLRDRREARSQLRAGQITHKEYDRALKGFKLLESKYQEAQCSAESKFFRRHWPKDVPRRVIGLRELLNASGLESSEASVTEPEG